jgi:hypothetical protein
VQGFWVLLCLPLFVAPAWAGYNEPVGCSQLPALTGSVTSSVGSCAVSGSTSSPSIQVFTSGSSSTYTTPAGAAVLRVTACGAGGGGGGVGASTGPNGTTGGTTTFNSVNAIGGSGGQGVTGATAGTGGAGGTGGTGTATYRVDGTAGRVGAGGITSAGPAGGVAALLPRSTGGTGGVALTTSRATGGGGGGGECFVLNIPNPAATYTYTVGTGGAGGVGTGTSAQTGGAGTDGIITVEEFYGVISAAQAYTFISTANVSGGASIAFTGLATYNNYVMVCRNVIAATAADSMSFQIGTGATPTWQTSSYKYFRLNGASNSSTVSGSNNASASGLDITLGSADNPHDLTLNLYDVLSTTKPKHMFYFGDYYDGRLTNYKTGAGAYTGANTAVTAVRIIAASGNISGVCTLYGLTQ